MISLRKKVSIIIRYLRFVGIRICGLNHIALAILDPDTVIFQLVFLFLNLQSKKSKFCIQFLCFKRSLSGHIGDPHALCYRPAHDKHLRSLVKMHSKEILRSIDHPFFHFFDQMWIHPLFQYFIHSFFNLLQIKEAFSLQFLPIPLTFCLRRPYPCQQPQNKF